MPLRGLRFTNSLLLTIAIATLTLPLASPASSQQPTRTCAQAKSAAQRRLTTIRNLTLRTETRNFSSSYPDYPAGRPSGYVLIMKGQAVDSVLRSRQFMTAIATDIITACDTISVVTFGRDGSGEFVNLGLLSNGTIDFFKCAEDFGINPEPGSEGRLRWGLSYCSI